MSFRAHSQSFSNGSPKSVPALAKSIARHGNDRSAGLAGDDAADPRAFFFATFEPLGLPTRLCLAIPVEPLRGTELAKTATTSASVHRGLVMSNHDLQFQISRIDLSVTPCFAASLWLVCALGLKVPSLFLGGRCMKISRTASGGRTPYCLGRSAGEQAREAAILKVSTSERGSVGSRICSVGL
eukprot:3941327-Rhodomonas_salina.3